MKALHVIVCLTYFGFSWSHLSQAQQRLFQVSPDKLEILLGEQKEITIRLTGASQDTLIFPNVKDQLDKRLEIIKTSQIDTQYVGDHLEQKVLSQTLLITSFDSAHIPNPPLVTVIGADTIQSNAFLVSVVTVNIAENQQIADIKDIERIPFAWDEWLKANWYWIALLILIIVLLVRLSKYLEKTKAPANEPKPVVPSISPHEIALESIAKLREAKRWQQGDIKGFYIELSTLLRTYFEQQFLIPALELTTEEILKAIARNTAIDSTDQSKIKQLLLLADLVKFAKEKPLGSENEQYLNVVETFVRAQQQRELTLAVNPGQESKQNINKEHTNG